jgi:hypothetical protein
MLRAGILAFVCALCCKSFAFATLVVVYDGASKKPIKGAKVFAYPDTADVPTIEGTTDDNGVANMNTMSDKEQSYTLHVTAGALIGQEKLKREKNEWARRVDVFIYQRDASLPQRPPWNTTVYGIPYSMTSLQQPQYVLRFLGYSYSCEGGTTVLHPVYQWTPTSARATCCCKPISQ